MTAEGRADGEAKLAPISDPRLIRLGDEVAVPFAPAAATVFLAIVVVAIGVIGRLGFGLVPRLPAWTGLIPAAVPGVFFAAILLRQWYRYFSSASLARRVLAEHAGSAWPDVAVRGVVHGRRRLRARAFDVREWFSADGNGTERPTVIAIECTPRAVAGEEVWEPVEVGASRRSTPAQRRRVLGQAAAVIAWIVLMSYSVMRVPAAYRWLSLAPLAVGGLVLVLNLLARLNVSLVSFTSAVASPGRLEHVSWGRAREFTPQDSVILVHGVPLPSLRWASRRRPGRPRMVIAWLVRRDGQRAALAFDHEADPGLSDLLTRWLARP